MVTERQEIRRVYLTYFLDGLPIVLGLEPGTWSVENLFINGGDFSRLVDVVETTLQDLKSKKIDYLVDARSLFSTYENLNAQSAGRVS